MPIYLKQLAEVTSSGIDAGTRKISNVVDPTLDQDVATKAYVDSGGGSSAVPTADDKIQTPSATAGAGASTGLTITSTPASDSYVSVLISGWYRARLGNGVKTEDCYFSSDGGTTAKSIANIASGDTLYWNGPTAGWELTALDWVDFDYVV